MAYLTACVYSSRQVEQMDGGQRMKIINNSPFSQLKTKAEIKIINQGTASWLIKLRLCSILSLLFMVYDSVTWASCVIYRRVLDSICTSVDSRISHGSQRFASSPYWPSMCDVCSQVSIYSKVMSDMSWTKVASRQKAFFPFFLLVRVMSARKFDSFKIRNCCLFPSSIVSFPCSFVCIVITGRGMFTFTVHMFDLWQ